MASPGDFKQIIVQYISDSGRIFSFSQTARNARAVRNVILPVRGVQGVPERWKMRYIIIQSLIRGEVYTRRIKIGNVNNPLFTGEQNTLQLDGVVWRVVARRGESSRGPKLSGD